MARELFTTTTGSGGGASNEEEAMQKLVGELASLDFDPVLLCGAHAFSMWLEIICGTSLGQGIARGTGGGGGIREFMVASELCGRIGFTLSRETINTRSGLAWQIEEQHVLLVRNPGLAAEEVAIYDRRSLPTWRH